jgi:ribonuclease Z
MSEGQDELRVGGLTLRGVTRGGIQTCMMVPELDVMFDVGPGVAGQLRYDTILVSHGHQDHLGGLPYLVSQRHLAGKDGPVVHAPREIEAPMRRIFEGWQEIEGFALHFELVPHDPEDEVVLSRNLVARCVRSVHRVPSLAWIVERHGQRLKPELAGVPGAELAERRKRGEAVTEPHTAPLLCVTGDTQIELFASDERLRRCRVLVHEVTGWDERRNVEQIRAWGHTHLDEMIPLSERFEGEALVLVHRSPRHSRGQAERLVRERFPASVRDKVHVFGT